MMINNIFRKLLFIIIWMFLIFDLVLAYYYFINAYWIEIFVKNPEFIHVHSWKTGDTMGMFLVIIISLGIYWLAYKTWFPQMRPKNLPAFRKSITTITGFVLLCNIFFIYSVLITEHFQNHWNVYEWMENDGLFLTVAYFTGEIIILAVLIAFQTGIRHFDL